MRLLDLIWLLLVLFLSSAWLAFARWQNRRFCRQIDELSAMLEAADRRPQANVGLRKNEFAARHEIVAGCPIIRPRDPPPPGPERYRGF